MATVLGLRKVLWFSSTPLCMGLSMLRPPKVMLRPLHILLDGRVRTAGTHSHRVDDFATHGNAVHAENMTKLQKTLKFRKWKSIFHSEGDCAGRTVIQDQSNGFHVHQAKFDRERLSPTVIPRGRRSDKKSETSDGEKRQLRAVWGSNERVALTCQHWHHLAWGHSFTVPCKIYVTRIWQLSG